MDLPVPNAQGISDYFRRLLTYFLDELFNKVPDGNTSNTETVKQSLRNVSNVYKNGLRFANSNLRSDWDDPANRCAYVFLYLMHHCYLVCGSLRYSDEVTRSWRNKNSLRVCSIGGGPGSDLVGLTTFLREQGIFPPSLECLVLDLYPSWKDTWDTIYALLRETFTVAYSKCDLVKDTRLNTRDLQFVKQADILTLSKSFSAVSAFFRADHAKGALLRQILQEVKLGGFVLYIDNECGLTQFQQDFADRAGLDLVFEFCGAPSFPKGKYSDTIKKYHRLFEFSPMRTCSVTIQLFRKKGAVLSGHAVRIESTPNGQSRAQSSSTQAAIQQVVHSVGTVSSSSRVVPHHRDDVISNYNISSRAASDIGPAYPIYNHPARGTVGQHQPRNSRGAPDEPITKTRRLTKTDTRCYQRDERQPRKGSTRSRGSFLAENNSNRSSPTSSPATTQKKPQRKRPVQKPIKEYITRSKTGTPSSSKSLPASGPTRSPQKRPASRSRTDSPAAAKILKTKSPAAKSAQTKVAQAKAAKGKTLAVKKLQAAANPCKRSSGSSAKASTPKPKTTTGTTKTRATDGSKKSPAKSPATPVNKTFATKKNDKSPSLAKKPLTSPTKKSATLPTKKAGFKVAASKSTAQNSGRSPVKKPTKEFLTRSKTGTPSSASSPASGHTRSLRKRPATPSRTDSPAAAKKLKTKSPAVKSAQTKVAQAKAAKAKTLAVKKLQAAAISSKRSSGSPAKASTQKPKTTTGTTKTRATDESKKSPAKSPATAVNKPFATKKNDKSPSLAKKSLTSPTKKSAASPTKNAGFKVAASKSTAQNSGRSPVKKPTKAFLTRSKTCTQSLSASSPASGPTRSLRKRSASRSRTDSSAAAKKLKTKNPAAKSAQTKVAQAKAAKAKTLAVKKLQAAANPSRRSSGSLAKASTLKIKTTTGTKKTRATDGSKKSPAKLPPTPVQKTYSSKKNAKSPSPAKKPLTRPTKKSTTSPTKNAGFKAAASKSTAQNSGRSPVKKPTPKKITGARLSNGSLSSSRKSTLRRDSLNNKLSLVSRPQRPPPSSSSPPQSSPVRYSPRKSVLAVPLTTFQKRRAPSKPSSFYK